MPRYEYPEIAEKITYKKTPMYKGEMFSANLEKNRITIEVEGEMKVKAGKLVVLSDDEYATLQAELEKAKELLRECQERFETILVIGVERDEVNVLIRKLNTESV